MLSSTHVGAPLKGRTTHVYGYGLLQKLQISLWLFINVFVWICRIAMGRKRKLKKVYCEQEVQKQNVVALKLAIEEQNVASPKFAIEEQNVVAPKFAIEDQNVVASKLRVGELELDQTSTQCNLKLAMVIVSNLSGRLNYFRIYLNYTLFN
jgi:hypothetical protein